MTQRPGTLALAFTVLACGGGSDSKGTTATSSTAGPTGTSQASTNPAGGSSSGGVSNSSSSVSTTTGDGGALGTDSTSDGAASTSIGGGAGEVGTGGTTGTGGAGTTSGGSTAMAPTGCDAPSWDEGSFQAVYDVGPDHEYATPSDVPWEDIEAGTLVRIHRRDEPYRDKWVLNYSGTEQAPIVVLGVPEGGLLPTISGDGATTREALNFTGEERSVIKVGTSSTPENDRPSHIHIECLDIQSAKPGYTFTNDSGEQAEYADNAATITIETGDYITVNNCELHDAGNGLFSAWQSSNVVISGNYIHDNGNAGSIYEHNSYTESQGITFEFNHYGSLCDGCEGNNLKDRSAGTVIRYNWIENGNRQLDLVETDHSEIDSRDDYGETFVYGNVLVEGDGEGNSQIIHYGGDGSGSYRAGTLFFYHNTVVSTRSGNTTLIRLSTDAESLNAQNNVFYVTASGSSFALLDGSGNATLSGNYLPEGYRDTHGTLTGTVTPNDNVEGSDPGFVDADVQDFALQAGAAAADLAVALASGASAYPVALKYVLHQSAAPRSATLDAGAFESE